MCEVDSSFLIAVLHLASNGGNGSQIGILSILWTSLFVYACVDEYRTKQVKSFTQNEGPKFLLFCRHILLCRSSCSSFQTQCLWCYRCVHQLCASKIVWWIKKKKVGKVTVLTQLWTSCCDIGVLHGGPLKFRLLSFQISLPRRAQLQQDISYFGWWPIGLLAAIMNT